MDSGEVEGAGRGVVEGDVPREAVEAGTVGSMSGAVVAGAVDAGMLRSVTGRGGKSGSESRSRRGGLVARAGAGTEPVGSTAAR